MSRHSFTTTHNGRSIMVVMGFDRPLQQVFMTVEDLDADEDQDELVYLYNNLNEDAPHLLTLDHFRDALQQLEIRVPESMFVETRRDLAGNIGNRMQEHTFDATH